MLAHAATKRPADLRNELLVTEVDGHGVCFLPPWRPLETDEHTRPGRALLSGSGWGFRGIVPEKDGLRVRPPLGKPVVAYSRGRSPGCPFAGVAEPVLAGNTG